MVTDTVLWSNDLLETTFYLLVGSAESGSEHPLGKAIVLHAQKLLDGKLLEPKDFVATSGQGLSCIVENKKILVGNRKWMETNGLEVNSAMHKSMVSLEEQV